MGVLTEQDKVISLNQSKELLYAWMAGFVDGEGTITICALSKRKRYMPKLAVCNTNYDSIIVFEEEFGGKVRKRSLKGKGSVKWKPVYEWSLTCNLAGRVVKLIKPYLKIKNKQAELLLKACEIKSKYNRAQLRWHKELKDEVNWELYKIRFKIRHLNKRGVPQHSGLVIPFTFLCNCGKALYKTEI